MTEALNDGVNNIPRLHSILEPRKTEAEQEFLANQFATAFTNELMNVLDLPADKREISSDENRMTSETNQKPEKEKAASLNRASAKSLELQTDSGANQKRDKEKAASLNRASAKSLELQSVLGANQKREKEKAASLNRASAKSLELQTDSGANQKRDKEKAASLNRASAKSWKLQTDSGANQKRDKEKAASLNRASAKSWKLQTVLGANQKREKEKAASLNRASAKSLEQPTVSGANKSQDVNRKQEKLGKTGGAHEENRMASRRGSWSGTKRRFRGRGRDYLYYNYGYNYDYGARDYRRRDYGRGIRGNLQNNPWGRIYKFANRAFEKVQTAAHRLLRGIEKMRDKVAAAKKASNSSKRLGGNQNLNKKQIVQKLLY